ncbi:MAG TPA: hypothetical protein VFL62_20240 [Bradyrhizobium sp.]|uniref:hypothetical protein n=1 Tax=Bradyrhizobium sp. TaxID=376 RepID=UPI002D803341|nr:hypothetical protein [Bradyrhizobium sp.]HET7888560.1 hypothetical protein [Bradyrhizobium sp.]
MMTPGFARARTFAASIAGLAMFAAIPAIAGEKIYDPPVGSRWSIETQMQGEEVRPDGTATSLIKTRAELTIEQKTADGYRISYVQRGATVEGNARSVPLRRAYAKALEDVVIRASTDAAGKPLRIDNLEEARRQIRARADELVGQFDRRPAARALFDQLMAELVEVDASSAAGVYIDSLALLAAAQNTGMKQGEVRQVTKPAENPLGGDALKSNERFELVETDATASRLKFVNATSVDPAAMNEFMQSFARSLLAASGDSVTPELVNRLVDSMVFSFGRQTEFEVQDGMTQKVAERSTTVFRGMEQNLIQTDTRTIRMTPAP